MDDYQILEWDSNFFGLTVSKILRKELGIEHLRRVLNELKTQNVQVAYWAVDNRDFQSRMAAESLNGFLADQKITYIIQLDEKKTDKLVVTIDRVEYHEAFKYETGVNESDVYFLFFKGCREGAITKGLFFVLSMNKRRGWAAFGPFVSP